MILGLGVSLIITALLCVVLIRQNLSLRMTLNSKMNRCIDDAEVIRHYTAHELRSPLRGIGRSIDWVILDHSTQLDESGIDQLQRLKSEVIKMDSVLDGISNYINIESHSSVTEVDLQSIITACGEVRQQKLQVQLISDTPMPTIMGNSSELTQLFSAIIDHAMYSVSPNQTREIHLSCSKEKGGWHFQIGPMKEMRPSSIEVLISKKIVAGYGGNIWETSSLSKGAIVHFTLGMVRLGDIV